MSKKEIVCHSNIVRTSGPVRPISLALPPSERQPYMSGCLVKR